MMIDPTQDQAKRFWDEMTELHGTTVVVRPKLGEIPKLSGFMKKVGVKDPSAYLDRFSIAVDKTIFTPWTPGSNEKRAWSQILTCVHEHEHVLSGRAWDFGALARLGVYLGMRSAQAQEEMRAYRTAMEMEFWRLGKIRVDRPARLANVVGKYWRIREKDVTVVRAALESSKRSIEQGAILGKVTKSAIDILERIAPGIYKS